MGDCKTGTIDGDAITKVDVFKDSLRMDCHGESAVIVGTQLLDLAYFFHNASKEGTNRTVVGLELGFGFGVANAEEEPERWRFEIEGVAEVGIGRSFKEVEDSSFWKGGL